MEEKKATSLLELAGCHTLPGSAPGRMMHPGLSLRRPSDTGTWTDRFLAGTRRRIFSFSDFPPAFRPKLADCIHDQRAAGGREQR